MKADSNILKTLKWQSWQEATCLQFAASYLAYWRLECNSSDKQTHDSILDLVAAIDRNLDLLKSEFLDRATSGNFSASVQILASRGPDEFFSQLDLAARLLLMINIRPAEERRKVLGSTSVCWLPNQSIIDLLHLHMPLPSSNTIETKFTRHLTALNLHKLGSFSIVWTDNILDHLTMDDERLFIFHQCTYLQNVSTSAHSSQFSDETRQTLALLFPYDDSECSKWLGKQIQRNYSTVPDPRIGKQAIHSVRDVNQYQFWRERLERLELAFEKTQPRTLRQWWIDRRNRVQWATFWIAAIVLFLSVIQCVTGIVQAWASVKALKSQCKDSSM